MANRLPRPAVLQRFGRLRVIIPEGRKTSAKGRRNGGHAALCLCDCGALRAVRHSHLWDGSSKSCGCLQRELARQKAIRHGLFSNAETGYIVKAFNGIQQRCTNPNCHSYSVYGGRGIELRFRDVDHLYQEVGPRPSPSHSIDRINTEGHYEPGNVKWSTPVEQQRNRRNNVVEGGKCLAQLAEEAGLPYGVVRIRYSKGERGDDLLRPLSPHQKPLVFNGKLMQQGEVAAALGISKGAMSERISSWPESRWFEPARAKPQRGRTATEKA